VGVEVGCVGLSEWWRCWMVRSVLGAVVVVLEAIW
jgi:hypothetical protein